MKQAFRVIPMTEAVMTPERYCLENVINCYGEDDYKHLYTLRVDDDGPHECDIKESDCKRAKVVTMAQWSDRYLDESEDVMIHMVDNEDEWYVFVDEDYFPDWI